MSFLAYNNSASLLRYLPEERKIVKQYKNEELMLTPQSNRSQLNEAVESLEVQWQSIRKQHLDHRSASKSPAKNNLANQLRTKDKQQILKKVVPLSTINLSHVTAQKNTLKESSHFQYIANKYSNIYRRPSPEQQRHQVISNSYQRNNLKIIDERVRTNSQDKNMIPLQPVNYRRDINPRKRVSQYQRNDSNNMSENRSQKSLLTVHQAAVQNHRIIPKRRN